MEQGLSGDLLLQEVQALDKLLDNYGLEKIIQLIVQKAKSRGFQLLFTISLLSELVPKSSICHAATQVSTDDFEALEESSSKIYDCRSPVEEDVLDEMSSKTSEEDLDKLAPFLGFTTTMYFNAKAKLRKLHYEDVVCRLEHWFSKDTNTLQIFMKRALSGKEEGLLDDRVFDVIDDISANEKLKPEHIHKLALNFTCQHKWKTFSTKHLGIYWSTNYEPVTEGYSVDWARRVYREWRNTTEHNKPADLYKNIKRAGLHRERELLNVLTQYYGASVAEGCKVEPEVATRTSSVSRGQNLVDNSEQGARNGEDMQITDSVADDVLADGSTRHVAGNAPCGTVAYPISPTASTSLHQSTPNSTEHTVERKTARLSHKPHCQQPFTSQATCMHGSERFTGWQHQLHHYLFIYPTMFLATCRPSSSTHIKSIAHTSNPSQWDSSQEFKSQLKEPVSDDLISRLVPYIPLDIYIIGHSFFKLSSSEIDQCKTGMFMTRYERIAREVEHAVNTGSLCAANFFDAMQRAVKDGLVPRQLLKRIENCSSAGRLLTHEQVCIIAKSMEYEIYQRFKFQYLKCLSRYTDAHSPDVDQALHRDHFIVAVIKKWRAKGPIKTVEDLLVILIDAYNEGLANDLTKNRLIHIVDVT